MGWLEGLKGWLIGFIFPFFPSSLLPPFTIIQDFYERRREGEKERREKKLPLISEQGEEKGGGERWIDRWVILSCQECQYFRERSIGKMNTTWATPSLQIDSFLYIARLVEKTCIQFRSVR